MREFSAKETKTLQEQALKELIEDIEDSIKTNNEELNKSYLNMVKAGLYHKLFGDHYPNGTQSHFQEEATRLEEDRRQLEAMLAKLKAYSIT